LKFEKGFGAAMGRKGRGGRNFEVPLAAQKGYLEDLTRRYQIKRSSGTRVMAQGTKKDLHIKGKRDGPEKSTRILTGKWA